ncbi:hypothetical protein [Nonomuraea sp. JJY05]|uniref:hypothetical protein n=1 Tax=Nonomuraea sp. JJY05 TaxID=3350255 RepID=UPI00373E0CC9
MRDERDLVRTLRAAAVQMEHHDLAAGVARRRRARRTRQRVRVVLAAAAVVAVVAGTAAIVSRSDDHRRAEPATVLHGWDSIRSAAELWPRAVVRVPAYDSEGWRTQVATSMSVTEVLLLATSKKERRLEVYDSARGTIRILGSIPEARDLRYVAVGTRYIAWYTGPLGGGPVNFWIMPRAGGAARRVSQVAQDVDSFGVTEDALVWSVRGGGVYRMPVTGGTPQLLPGTDGLRLTYWPWAAGAIRNRIVNLETDESTEVSLPDGVRSMQCHPEWCVGAQGQRAIVQRVDGSERQILPEQLRPITSARLGLLGDRYAIFGVRDEPMKRGVPLGVVYDLETGAMAKLGERPFAAGDGSVGYGYSTSPSTAPFWWTGSRVQDAKEYIVLNVAAIPR